MRGLLALATIVNLALLAGCAPPPTEIDCATHCASSLVPPATCVDWRTLREFTIDLEECSAVCRLLSRDSTCANECRQGVCVDAMMSSDGGETDGGETDGGETDGGALDAGVADAGSDPCAGVSCSVPPANVCLDGTRLQVFEARGVCGAGGCTYGASEQPCANGCAAGACVGSPCQGVTCSTPPANVCVNSTTLRTYMSSGVCAQGACEYASQQLPCTFGCVNGQCMNDPCAGVTCAQPPASFCASTSTLRTFAVLGTCASGSCSYAPTDSTCSFGCSNGACAGNPCQGVSCTTPPATACVSSSTLRSYAPAGTCSAGTCSYTATDSTCSFGCSSGACAGNPCQGVSCTIPPAATCSGPATRRTFASVGTCSLGACSYQPTDTTCSTTVAPTCATSTTLRTYAAATCASGACTNVSTDVNCPGGCAAGACLPVVCTRAATRPCSSECFCEESKIDDEMLNDVWAFSSSDVWAVGSNGGLVHFDGGTWAKTPQLTTATLRGAWGLNGHLWVVGAGGTVLHYEGGNWEQLDAGTTETLTSIDGTSNSSFKVVGNGGLALSYDGTGFTPMTTGVTGNLTGIAGNYAVGSNPANGSPIALSYSGSSWTSVTSSLPALTGALTSIWNDASGSLAVGSAGTVLNRLGTTWTLRTHPVLNQSTRLSRVRSGWIVGDVTLRWASGALSQNTTMGFGWKGVHSSPTSRTFFVAEGIAASWDAFSGTRTNYGAKLDYRAAWGSSANDVWLVGQDSQTVGRVIRWDGTRVTEYPITSATQIRLINDVWGSSASNVYAVANGAAIYRFNGTSWQTIESAVGSNYTAISGSAADNIWVGGNNRVRRFDGTSWTNETPTGLLTQVNDLWTSGPDDVWAVSYVGRVSRRTSAGWAAVSTGTTNELSTVWGSGPGDVWIGGDTYLARWSGSAFVQVTLPVLLQVKGISGRSANDVYVTGTVDGGSGVTLHWNGTQWRTVDVGSSRMATNLWLGPPGVSWFVGNGVARAQQP